MRGQETKRKTFPVSKLMKFPERPKREVSKENWAIFGVSQTVTLSCAFFVIPICTRVMAEEAGRRRTTKRLDTESAASSSSPRKSTADEAEVSPRSSGSSSGRTRLGSLTKEKESSGKAEKEKSKSKDKDKEGRNKHALSRTAARQNSIMPIPMPSPDKVEEVFTKLLVRNLSSSIFNFSMQNEKLEGAVHVLFAL